MTTSPWRPVGTTPILTVRPEGLLKHPSSPDSPKGAIGGGRGRDDRGGRGHGGLQGVEAQVEGQRAGTHDGGGGRRADCGPRGRVLGEQGNTQGNTEDSISEFAIIGMS